MAKAKINPPEHPISHLNYQRSCQLALEPSLAKLLDLAKNAGWDLHQATYAVMILAATHFKDQAPSEEAPENAEPKDNN